VGFQRADLDVLGQSEADHGREDTQQSYRDQAHGGFPPIRSENNRMDSRIPRGALENKPVVSRPPARLRWWQVRILQGQAQYAAGEYEAAVETLRRDETYSTSSRRFLAASLAQLGRLDEARAEVGLFLVGNPHFTTRHWATTEPFRDAATLEHFVDGYARTVFRSDAPA
jgi:Tetratricopeptide repeat